MPAFRAGEEKAQYQAIADIQRKAIAKWLAENLIHAFDITHAGVTKSLGGAAAEPLKVLGTSSPRDLINALSSTALAPSFEGRFPGYPSFSGLNGVVTEASRAQTASEGLRFIAGSIRTDQGAAVVDGLGLREAGAINPTNSSYAGSIRKVLAGKAEGHVVNRNELVVTNNGVEVEATFGLEPEWLSVVLLALAYRGEIEISTGAQVIDATNLPAAASLGAEALGRFKTIQRPKATPISALKALFEMLDLNPSLLDFDQDDAAAKLQSAVVSEIEAALSAMVRIEGAMIGGAPLWSQPEAQMLIAQIGVYKDFLDRLTSLNTGGKLKQYKTTVDALGPHTKARAALREVSARLARLREFEILDEYLRDASATLIPDDLWQLTAKASLEAEATAVGGSEADVTAAKKSLREAKAAYISRYLDLHNAARLDHTGDDSKKRLMGSDTMRRLNLLESVQMLSSSLTALKSDLAGLVMCRNVDAIELETATSCRACHFKPALDPIGGDAGKRLAALETAFETMNTEWSAFLANALSDPIAESGLALLEADRAAAVRNVADPTVVPDPSAIQDLNRVLQGLQKVVIEGDALLAALRSGGPATEGDLEERFQRVVKQSLKAKDPATVRLVIE